MKPIRFALCSAALALAGALSGCGDDGSSNSHNASPASATCASFTYQFEAQVYMRTHKDSQLDPDENGVACDELPRKPVTTTTPSGGIAIAGPLAERWTGSDSESRRVIVASGASGRRWMFYGVDDRVDGFIEGEDAKRGHDVVLESARDHRRAGGPSLPVDVRGSVRGSNAWLGVSSENSAGSRMTVLTRQDVARPSRVEPGRFAMYEAEGSTELRLGVDRSFAGQDRAGCRFRGRLDVDDGDQQARSEWTATIRFDDATCAGKPGQWSGIAIIEGDRLILAATDAERESAFLFDGRR